MLNEKAIAICTPLQKRRRLQTSGIKMPSGKKSITLPRAFRTQNARALEPLGRVAEKQVSDARLGRSSIPTAALATDRDVRAGGERSSGKAGEIDDGGQEQDFPVERQGGARESDDGTAERPTNREGRSQRR